MALFNIIDNVIKYTKQGGIKGAFARGEEAKKVHGFGRGIGVYITGHIINAHKGKIWAESKGKGKGTTFFVEL